MDPITAGLLVGGINAVGGYFGQKETNSANQHMAEQQMQFQDRMSGQAHQREVKDLAAAGLNPILSAGGSGAPMAQGATAEMGSPLSAMTAGISKGADTAIAMRAQNTALENTKQDTANKIAQQALIQNQSHATAKEIEAKAYSNKIMEKTLDSQIKKANAEGNYAELNQIMGLVNAGSSSASSLINPFTKLRGK